jgi:hypothetical protein
MKEGRTGFVSMAIGLVLIFIGFSMWEYEAFTLQSKINSPAASSTNNTYSTSAPIQIAGWKTYQDNQYNFSIQYPADFSLTEEPGASVSLVVPVKDYFKTQLTSEASLTINNPASTCAANPNDQYATTSAPIDSPAGAFQKSHVSDVGAGQLYDTYEYTLSKGGMCYELVLLMHSTNGAGFYYSDPAKIASTDAQEASDKAAFVQLIDRVVSTFSFVK